MTNQHDRRIARNTAFLYGKMLLTICISLYTSRVVLDTLGVADFGTYSIVGCVVTVFAFLNGSMAGATQRFLNYEMGLGTRGKLTHTFAASLLIHIGIALLLFVVGETVGLWYVNCWLKVAPERLMAANITYQLSLVAGAVSIIQVPFTASVISHERMDIFAYVSLLNAVLRLAVALSLMFIGNADSLIVYAVLMLLASVIVMMCYVVYCRRHFKECQFKRAVPMRILRGILKFSMSDIFGNLCYTLRVQGMPMILNRFGGTVLNAAAGLTVTVSGAITQFGTSIIAAFRPQIIQQYAAQNFENMQRLMINCSKYAVLMVALFAIPAIIKIDLLLGLWLKQVPAYTNIFCQLTIMAGICELVVFTLNCGIHATGRILRMSVITGIIYLVELPVMWCAIWWTHQPWVVYAIHVMVMMLIALIVAIILRRQMTGFAIGRFAIRAVIMPAFIIVAAAAAAFAVSMAIENEWADIVATTLTSTAVLASLTWIFVLDRDTRADLLNKLRNKFTHRH